MKRGNDAVWMIIIFGVLAVIILLLLIGFSVGSIGKGKDGFNQGFDAVTRDIDCDGIPDQMDTDTSDTSKCDRSSGDDDDDD